MVAQIHSFLNSPPDGSQRSTTFPGCCATEWNVKLVLKDKRIIKRSLPTLLQETWRLSEFYPCFVFKDSRLKTRQRKWLRSVSSQFSHVTADKCRNSISSQTVLTLFRIIPLCYSPVFLPFDPVLFEPLKAL
jgi:hypothetical protein